jgi:transcriptional regulator with XRE-family HTH domain
MEDYYLKINPIAAYKKAANLSLAKLADSFGVGVKAARNFCNGESTPTVGQMLTFAENVDEKTAREIVDKYFAHRKYMKQIEKED